MMATCIQLLHPIKKRKSRRSLTRQEFPQDINLVIYRITNLVASQYESDKPWYGNANVRKDCQLTGPKDLESRLETELSPSAQKCPSGTFNTSSKLGIPIQSPGNPIILFMCFSLWLVGELQDISYSDYRSKIDAWKSSYTDDNHISKFATTLIEDKNCQKGIFNDRLPC